METLMTRPATGALLLALLMLPLEVPAGDDPRPAPAPVAAGGGEASWRASGKRGAVAAGGLEAVKAGMEVLSSGGNAVDAAVATILALTVTDAESFCFGGEVPILVYHAKRNVVEVLAGQGAAPRLATRERFQARGGIPLRGLEPAAVPAALDACLTALERYGTRTFAQAAAPTLRLLAANRKPWHADLEQTLRRLIDAEKAAGGDRPRGLRLVADYFYRGPLAAEIVEWCSREGGLLGQADLATHVTRIEEPAHVEYRGFTVYKCGVWTQGPWLLEALNLLSGFDLKSLGHNRPQAIHLIIEAMKLGLADRDAHYADPLFERVPAAEILSMRYADLRRPLIDPGKASLLQRPGDPLAGKPLLEEPLSRLAGPARAAPRDTTTCLVADAEGNVVAATPSGWSGVLVGRTGVWLGTRLQSFNTWPGHPNRIEPGKRPRITLTPTLVLRDGRPVLAVSVAGGDGQDQVSLQMVLDSLDFGLGPAESVTAVRFGTDHHVGSFGQRPPDLGSLLIHETAGEAVVGDLQARGHRVRAVRGPLWAPSVLRIDPGSGLIEAAGDPRAGRHAAAY